MTDYTISCKLSNETVYAYYRGRFWHWNGSIWKESRIMTHRFELARVADKKLTPQEFLTNGAEFAPLDEYEIDCVMLDALENAKPCRNAPIEPVEEESECAPAQNADAAVTMLSRLPQRQRRPPRRARRMQAHQPPLRPRKPAHRPSAHRWKILLRLRYRQHHRTNPWLSSGRTSARRLTIPA